MAESDRDPQAVSAEKKVAREREAMADLEALLRSAQAALTRASETVPSAEERRAEAAAAEALAASGAGDVAKTAVGVAGRLRRQWLRWLTEHGEAYELNQSDAERTQGPSWCNADAALHLCKHR